MSHEVLHILDTANSPQSSDDRKDDSNDKRSSQGPEVVSASVPGMESLQSLLESLPHPVLFHSINHMQFASF